MVSSLSLHLQPRFYNSQSFGPYTRTKINSRSIYSSRFHGKSLRHWFKSLSQGRQFREFPSRTVSSQKIGENVAFTSEAEGDEMEFNRVNCLVWILHESARSFNLAVESLELTESSPGISMAWIGKDVHVWHKRIAYRVAVYSLLKAAVEVEAETLLSNECYDYYFRVEEILSAKINALGGYIENQLSKRHSELVEWFRVIEIPRIEKYFTPLLKKWSVEYGGSGVAGLIVAISCCAAVRKLDNGRLSCPLFKMSIEDLLIKLMDISCSLVPLKKLHQLATDAGFELELLFHFGTKILPSDKTEELGFWIGLAHRKLSAAFHRENVLSKNRILHERVQEDSLATLGLFAYLGRASRIFLLSRDFQDLDELVMDFLSYLECGSLFVYPELSSVSSYQLFMEIVTDEIGWLDLYAAFPSTHNHYRKSKHHGIQAEKEIVLSYVCTVCHNVFSGFAHLRHSIQQPLDSDLIDFLNRSQSLRRICLEESSGINGFSRELPKIAETGSFRELPVSLVGMTNFSEAMELGQKLSYSVSQRHANDNSQLASNFGKVNSLAQAHAIVFTHGTRTSKPSTKQESLIQKYSNELISATSDLWMGTQLLFIDIAISTELLLKRFRGHKVTTREHKKLNKTLNDVAALIPITILMLLPVSAVGHAAMLAAIKKYIPSLIPSPYSGERLYVVKQLKKTKKMEIHLWGKLDDHSTTL